MLLHMPCLVWQIHIIQVKFLINPVSCVLSRDRYTPRHKRDHDLRIAYLSPQQLRSFNLPFQLGYT
jgi:hypothetical protein